MSVQCAEFCWITPASAFNRLIICTTQSSQQSHSLCVVRNMDQIFVPMFILHIKFTKWGHRRLSTHSPSTAKSEDYNTNEYLRWWGCILKHCRWEHLLEGALTRPVAFSPGKMSWETLSDKPAITRHTHTLTNTQSHTETCTVLNRKC